jgi:hypothetical protein
MPIPEEVFTRATVDDLWFGFRRTTMTKIKPEDRRVTEDMKTPADLCRELGIEDNVSPLVELIHTSQSKALTADIVRFAMAVGARGVTAYQERGNVDVVRRLKHPMGLSE